MEVETKFFAVVQPRCDWRSHRRLARVLVGVVMVEKPDNAIRCH
jgi:hypothetical protein